MYLTQREFLASPRLSDDHVVVLKEPFTIDQLRRAVREAFDGPRKTGQVRNMDAASRRRTCTLISVVYE